MNECCANTGYKRKYAIWKLRHYQLTPRYLLEKSRRKRGKTYDSNELFTGFSRLYANFFQLITNVLRKKMVESKIIKRYDRARTPYQRGLECPDLSSKIKKELTTVCSTLNPIILKKEIDRRLDKIYDLRTAKTILEIKIQFPDTVLSKI